MYWSDQVSTKVWTQPSPKYNCGWKSHRKVLLGKQENSTHSNECSPLGSLGIWVCSVNYWVSRLPSPGQSWWLWRREERPERWLRRDVPASCPALLPWHSPPATQAPTSSNRLEQGFLPLMVHPYISLHNLLPLNWGFLCQFLIIKGSGINTSWDARVKLVQFYIDWLRPYWYKL